MDDTNNYINTYTPPATGQSGVTPPPVTEPAPAAPEAPAAPAATSAPVEPVPAPAAESSPAPASSTTTSEPVSTPPAETTPASAPAAPAVASQTLEDQNIFFLLGVTDGTDQEKEAFLDELQQVIWEDFLENDVELLITEEEMAELKKIMAQKELSNLELQEKIIVYLEKLIPDLEEIMLEKALELKEDMARERVAGMREYYASNQPALDKIQEAETAMNNNQWRAAAEFLNSL